MALDPGQVVRNAYQVAEEKDYPAGTTIFGQLGILADIELAIAR
jgi:hypothetical protein